MEPRTKNLLRSLGWWVILFLLLILIGRMWQQNRKKEVRIPESDWAKLQLVLQSVDRDYVDEIDQKAVTEKILPDLLAALDPHSVYLPPVELKEAEEDLQGGFDGIGIQFSVPNDTAIVSQVIVGGPSEKAGLLSGDRVVQVDDRVIAGVNMPQDSMVRLMKGSGIGTPATRAAIIERLIKVGYAARRGKTLNATDKGVMLIDVMPQELASPETTGRWELALHEITDGKQDPDRFMSGIRKMSAFLVEYARDQAKPLAFPPDTHGKKGGAKGNAKGSTVIEGTVCPVCGKGKMRENYAAFGCTEPGCKCTLWKDCMTRGGGPALTGKLVTQLLDRKELQGSTGILAIRDGKILFIPNGSDTPAVSRSLIYEKKS